MADLQEWHKQLPEFTYDTDGYLMKLFKESMPLSELEKEYLNQPTVYRNIEQNTLDADLHHRIIDQWYGRNN